jgi:hypothetical protein
MEFNYEQKNKIQWGILDEMWNRFRERCAFPINMSFSGKNLEARIIFDKKEGLEERLSKAAKTDLLVIYDLEKDVDMKKRIVKYKDRGFGVKLTYEILNVSATGKKLVADLKASVKPYVGIFQ